MAQHFLIARCGHFDARGYRQWRKAGRQVKKGEHATYILAPRMVRRNNDGGDAGDEAEGLTLVGFIGVPVFGLDQTEGEPVPGMEDEHRFIDGLPVVEVARSWGLSVVTFDSEAADRLGFYRHGKAIGVGGRNLSIWAHELVHAADDRLGTVTMRRGQQLDTRPQKWGCKEGLRNGIEAAAFQL